VDTVFAEQRRGAAPVKEGVVTKAISCAKSSNTNGSPLARRRKRQTASWSVGPLFAQEFAQEQVAISNKPQHMIGKPSRRN